MSLGARRAVEEFERTRARILEAAPFDGFQVGLVRPDERVVAVAQPHGMGDGVEEPRHGAQIAARRGQLVAGAQEFCVVALHVAQAKDGASAAGASFRLHIAARERAGGEVEGFAAALEVFERAFEGRRIARRHPGPEGEHAFHGGAVARDRRVALEARLAAAGGPDHQQLPLGAHQESHAILGAAQAFEFGKQPPFARDGAAPLPAVECRRGGGDAEKPQHERKGCGAVQIEGVEGVQERAGLEGGAQGRW
jgi:hypothetical protein